MTHIGVWDCFLTAYRLSRNVSTGRVLLLPLVVVSFPLNGRRAQRLTRHVSHQDARRLSVIFLVALSTSMVEAPSVYEPYVTRPTLDHLVLYTSPAAPTMSMPGYQVQARNLPETRICIVAGRPGGLVLRHAEIYAPSRYCG